jgi:hypothetical protein
MKPKLIILMGGKGGLGKTAVALQLTDWLQRRGYKLLLIDCDSENANQGGSFNHWLGGKALALNLRKGADRDRLLEEAAASGAQFIVADLPGNSSGDLSDWLQGVATRETIEMVGLDLIAVGCVTHEQESSESAVKWVHALGDRARYLIVLNRKALEVAPARLEERFADWFQVALPKLVPGVVSADRLKTVELGHMEDHAMDALKRIGKLPSKVIKDPKVPVLIRVRAQSWRDRFHEQLEATGWFALETASTEAAPAAP